MLNRLPHMQSRSPIAIKSLTFDMTASNEF